MRVQFLGAAGTVTGSRYLLEGAAASLLVDCGLFQGYKQLRMLNAALLFASRLRQAIRGV